MNELTTVQEIKELPTVEQMKTITGFAYSSLEITDKATAAKFYNATSNPTHQLADCINKTVTVQDVYIEMLELTDSETGEVTTAPRTVLISPNGESYVAVSVGVYNSIRRLFNVFGTPHKWEEPIEILVKQKSKGTNQILLFEVVI